MSSANQGNNKELSEASSEHTWRSGQHTMVERVSMRIINQIGQFFGVGFKSLLDCRLYGGIAR